MQPLEHLEKISAIHEEIVNELYSAPKADFVANAIKQLARTLRVRYAFITECSDLTLTKVKTLYFWNKDRFMDNVEYELVNTPCEQVIAGEVCFYPEGIQELFPKDQDLVDLSAIGYVAAPLLDSNNEVIGHLVVMDQAKLGDEESIKYTLKVYAFRLAIEMEKQHTVNVSNALTDNNQQNNITPFEQLAVSINKLLNIDYVMICNTPDFSTDQMHSLSIYNQGTFLEPICYSLEGAPCTTNPDKRFQIYPSNVQFQFPDFQLLKQLDANAYLGTLLFDSNDNVIGQIAVIHRKPIKNTARIEQVLEIFGQQAAYEIERKNNQQHVQYYQGIISASDDFMSFIDKNYIYRFVNECYRKVFDKPFEEIIGHSVLELHGEEIFHGGLKKNIDKALQGEVSSSEFWRTLPNGERRCIYGRHNPYYDAEGNITGISIVARDITELKNIQLALSNSEQRLQSLYDDTPAMFITLDKSGDIKSINRHGAQELGYETEELIGHNISAFIFEEDKQKFSVFLNYCFQQSDTINELEIRKTHKDGHLIWYRDTARRVEAQDGDVQMLIVSEDISERHKLSQQLSYQASHDFLTNLINRPEFENRLQDLLNAAKDSNAEHALCYIDLDQFKIINDECGHLAGDTLLKNISELLKGKIRKRDTLARLGGDEFAILMEDCTIKKALPIAESIRKLIIDYDFIWGNTKYNIGASIGVISIDSNSDSIIKLMSMVDSACYVAKDAGRNRVHVYKDNDAEITRHRGEIKWVNKIKHAIDKNKFCLYTQKIIDVRDETSSKKIYEFLIRLKDDDKIITPAQFLPSAERYNLSTQIDEWVVKNVFKWLAAKKKQLNKIHYCTINLSGLSIGNEVFLDYVLHRLEKSGLPGEKICFEITETTAIANLAKATYFINKLNSHGCLFALDDFGSGVSSFGYLKNLPVDYIKIDGSFIVNIMNDPIDLAMTRSINDIAHVMGKKTVAEFVEDDQTLAMLKKIGVDYAQGYGIGKPRKARFS